MQHEISKTIKWYGLHSQHLNMENEYILTWEKGGMELSNVKQITFVKTLIGGFIQ